MSQKNTSAFTLVELIVVITILAVLATIAYMSLTGYAQSARNSTRISDMKLIEKSMGVYIISQSQYPSPDSPNTIMYNGKEAWTQGFFGNTAFQEIRIMSEIPTDPLTGNKYSYGVINSKNQYQVGAALEGRSLTYSPSIGTQAYAFKSNGLSTYILGEYIGYDIKITNGTGCSLISIPSLLLSDMPAGGIITDGGFYNYSYSQSSQLPNSYSGYVDSIASGSGFQITEVLDTCNISNLSELELYIAQLSTTYQQLSNVGKYEKLIFQSNTASLKLEVAENLIHHGILVDPSIIRTLKNPAPEKAFIDTFNDSDTTQLTSGHTPNSASGSWSLVSGVAADYTISSNSLIKNGGSSSLLIPVPIPSIGINNYSVSFDVNNFSAGSIFVYLRYTDSNNFYRLEVLSSGYKLSRMLGGINSIFQNINDPISLGSTIYFSVNGDSLVLRINNIEKENIVAGGVNSIGNPVILLQNDGTSIDNFTLNYKE